ncbi:dUTP diphosphatase [Amnibacterium endophyticum]|uniref:dUTP diphosphatase n=1 Tax=Amnibacterium endophyticum TaxID=2109337 RepID=A0ABW4LHG3_9MICO
MIEVLVDGAAPLPALPGDAGADLLAAEAVSLPPLGRATVGTGLAIALPAGTAALVLPRSGLAARHGITIVNAPGLVDAGYRGEIRVTLLNTDATAPYDVAVGDRIAQLVVLPLPAVRFVPVASLPGSHRASGGFGSTGTGARGEQS